MDFMVIGEPRDVLSRTEVYIVGRGFEPTANSTETTRLYTQKNIGCLGCLAAVVTLGISLLFNILGEGQWIQCVAYGEGEGRTRLIVTSNKADLQREMNEWVLRELGGAPLDASGAPVAGPASVTPVYTKSTTTGEWLVFDDRVEIRSSQGPAQVIRSSDIKEVRTEWGRMRAFAKLVVEAHDGREMELGQLHMREAQNLKKAIEQHTLSV